MAVKIELKRSSVPGKIPTTSSLDLGELALNTYDGRAFLKQQQGTTQSIVELATTAGSGSTVATASFAITSSYALTASFAENFNPNATASYALSALSASYATTADYALNSAPGFSIVTGSVTASVNLIDNIFLIKSGSSTLFSINNEGTTVVSGSAPNLFLIKNASNKTVLAVSQSGVIVLSVQSTELTGPAPNGGIYFTSNSLFIGVD